MATPVTEAEASADVSLTIEEYCEIAYSGTTFSITLSGGASGGSDNHSYSAGANFSAEITGSFTKPPTPSPAPGTWDWKLENDTKSVTFGPGTHPGSVTVSVEGVELGDGNGEWTGGDMTITVQAAPT